jgi:molybdopterin synthase catalytic subunit/molybdopterin converting factor small subunit
VKVRIMAFASAAEALGGREIEVPDGCRLDELRGRLEAEHADLRELWPRLAVAVGGELVPPDASLAPGDEVALLPPVSGGGPARARLVEEPIDLDALEVAVRRPGSGAVVLFVGRVRDQHAGRDVVGLTYEAYRPMAEAALARIADELTAAAPGLEVSITHRLGELTVGDASVAIAVSSPHRTAAFEASRTALERLKREVPIWKLERYADGAARWREEEPLNSAAPTDRPRDSRPRSRRAG